MLDFSHEIQAVDDIVEQPANVGLLWEFFKELNERREFEKGFPKLLSYKNILDWSQVTGVQLAGWQIRAILKADIGYLIEYRKK